jgi:hypothetical protein
MLVAYQQRTRLLLGDEKFNWLRDGDLINYINEARNQVAGESECLVDYSSLAVSAASQMYPFSQIVITAANVTAGFGQVLNVRTGSFSIGDVGHKLVYPRAWSWYQLYTLNQPVPAVGEPREFAQQGQGVSGTLWINLLDTDYVLNLDTVCLPVPLVDDTTVEAIPLLWTIPVSFYAAWLAMMTRPAPDTKPDDMLQRYEQMMGRARAGATSQVLPHIQSQGPDLANANRYGISQGRGGG